MRIEVCGSRVVAGARGGGAHLGEILRDLVFAAHDLVVGIDLALGDEGRLADEHLVDEDAERPPVGADVVALVGDDLGREVLGRAAEGPRAVLDVLGEAKVHKFEVAVLIKEQVLRLEVAVGDLSRVEVGEGGRDHRPIEDGRLLIELTHRAQLREKLAAQRQLEHHVDLRLTVERRHHVQDERVVAPLQHALLVHHVLHLLVAHELPLVEAFQRERRLVRLVEHQLDAAEGALPNEGRAAVVRTQRLSRRDCV